MIISKMQTTSLDQNQTAPLGATFKMLASEAVDTESKEAT